MTDLKQPRDQVRGLIVDRIELGLAMLNHPIQSESDFRNLEAQKILWHKYNGQMLEKVFTDELVSQDYSHQGPSIGVWSQTLQELVQDLQQDIDKYILRLRSILDRLDLFDESSPSVAISTESSEPPTRGKAVFIVHGHGRYEHEVARAISDIGSTPIILQEQLHEGSASLLAKLSREGERCGYAIVIYTGDDVGKAADSSDELRPRARENVVLELGYFLGLLGHQSVTVLHDAGVDFPSDFSGIGYYPLDSEGGWKAKIQGELRRAGIVS